MAVILGEDVGTGIAVYLGDAERCGGLYLLGKPRTGKSTLLISLALQDMASGHGLLFIDPHSDAVRDLLTRIPAGRERDVILLDPNLEEQAFGINPLTCQDPQSYKEITFSYGLARDVFVKVFGDPQTGELGILLNKYLRNSLYPLLENPGHTLVDIRAFLIHKSFRNRLLQRVKINPEVVNFWQGEFERLSKRDQDEQIQSTLNRLDSLLTDIYVKHIVGQVKTRVDFTRILKERKIVLLRMPAGLSEDTTTFIGTLIISQLLKAVWLRQEADQEDRPPFALYCDEFQHFATPDFAKLFTQTGKFKIMPTVAHQERVGQFRSQDPNRGATLAAPNKTLFGLSAPDSKELSPEFAREPPTETRLEEQIVISQNPFSDILRGHANPHIRGFVDKYFRPLQERTEDIRGDVDLERLIRDDYRDKAAIERIIAQINAPRDRFGSDRAQLDALQTAMSSLLFARSQTEKLTDLYQSSKELRQTIRGFNKFLTGIMDGRIKRGQEIFSQFLIAITRVQEFSLVPNEYAPLLELYLTLQYGDPQKAPAIPFALAHAHGLFSSAVAKLIWERDEKIKQHSQAYFKKEMDALRQRQAEETQKQERDKKERAKKALVYLTPRCGSLNYSEEELLKYYIFMHMDKDVQRTLEPYYTARFTPQWRDRRVINISEIIGKVLKWVDSERRSLNEAKKYKDEYSQKWFTLRPTITGGFKFIDRRHDGCNYIKTIKSDQLKKGIHYQVNRPFGYKLLEPLFTWCNIKYFTGKTGIKDRDLKPEAVYEKFTWPFFADFLLDDFQKWLTEYEEGAIVVLILLKTAFGFGRPESYKLTYGEIDKEYRGRRFNSLHIPALVNRDALEVFLLLDKLCAIISGISSFESKCARYYWLAGGENPYEKYANANDYIKPSCLVFKFNDPERISKGLLEDPSLEWFDKQLQDKEFFEKLREEGRYQWWFALSEATRIYLKRRANDIAYYGKEVADISFPRSAVYGVTVRQVEELVDRMAAASLIYLQEYEEEKLNNAHQWIQKQYESEKALIRVPEVVPSRALAASDIEAVKKACLSEIYSSSSNWNGKDALSAIEEFVEFCTLLAKPENHIKGRTGQFVERQVNTRTFADMEVEMAWELVNLPKYTAYVKITQEQEGKQVVVKRKIRTYRLPSEPKGRGAQAMEKIILQQNYSLYYKKRRDIEEEIAMRQQKQLAPSSDSSPPTHVEGGQDSSPLAAIDTPSQGALLPSGDVPDPDAPPPPGFSNPAAQEAKEPVQPKTGNNPEEKGLIYRSNFYLPDDRWTEKETTDAKKFRRDGYYHIELNRSYTTVELIEIPVTDFRVHVDVELLKGEAVVYGVCFRCIKVSNGLSFYLFAFDPKSWGLLYYRNGDCKYLLDYRSCEFSKQDSINALMVQMVGQRITLGINGHILATVTDNCLTSGYVGLFMKKEGGPPVAARFRDFRLYSLE